jgi:hypothetical protein
MTDAIVVHTDHVDSGEAGRALGSRISAALAGSRPDALIVFASSRYDYLRPGDELPSEDHGRLFISWRIHGRR